MSFASMHNDYLDPDRAGLNDEDWGLDFEEVHKILDEWSSGRWDWDKITYCLTGKYADLDPHGQQGVELVSVDEHGVHFVVHGGKTIAGIDVCLNSNEDHVEAYLDAMQEMVCGANSAGEWGGDDWYMTFREEASVPWIYLDDGVTPDYEATCRAVIAKLEEVLGPWEQEMASLDHWGNVLAGWSDLEGNQIKEGDPCPHAAWNSDGSEE